MFKWSLETTASKYFNFCNHNKYLP